MAKAKFRSCRFRPCELSPKAWDVYRRSKRDDNYLRDAAGNYYLADNPQGEQAIFLGSNINDVNIYFEEIYDMFYKEA